MIAVDDQARGYWVAARALRHNEIPGDVADNLLAHGELTAACVRTHSVQTLCVLGAEATLPRLRRRILREWPAMVPTVEPAPPEPAPPEPAPPTPPRAA